MREKSKRDRERERIGRCQRVPVEREKERTREAGKPRTERKGGRESSRVVTSKLNVEIRVECLAR